MGALPKRKISSRRQGKRRGAISLALTNLINCRHCGAKKRSHEVCRTCGKR